METVQSIEQAFRDIHDVKADEKFVSSCMNIVNEYGATAEDIATLWETNALRMGANGGSIDVSAMLKKISNELSRDESLKKRRLAQLQSTPLARQSDIKKVPGYSTPIASVASSYSNNTKRMRLPPPEATPAKNLGAVFDAVADGSPRSSSYADRKDIGKVQVKFNEMLQDLNADRTEPVIISVEQVVESFKYMNHPLPIKARCLENRLESMHKKLCEENNIPEDSVATIGTQSQTEIVVCGMICCDAPEGKINAESLLLEGSRTHDHGHRIKLDVSHLDSYSLFPGQVVLVRGMNPEGHTIYANQIYTSAVNTQSIKSINDVKPVSMIVAAGPYTTSDSLNYHPLEDLLSQVVIQKPDVLLMMGPFVDKENDMIKSGQAVLQLDGMEPQLMKYEDFLSYIVARVTAATEALHTKVLMVPSTDDVTTRACFPQPALDCDLGGSSKMTTLSNPARVTIHGVDVVLSTQDVVFDLSTEDVSRKDKSVDEERLVRLARHIFTQGSCYPMFPPSVRAVVDYTQSQAFEIETPPHLFINTSRLSPFAKAVDKTVFLNPGKLVRGRTGGLYATVQISPQEAESDLTKCTKILITRI